MRDKDNDSNHIESKQPESGLPLSEDHLAACSDCVEFQELHSLVLQLQHDARFEPPAGLVQWMTNVFRALQPVPARKSSRRILGSLIFDTFDQPVLAGVRLAGAPPRQFVFHAGGIDIDLRVEPTQAGRITMTGQVLSQSGKFYQDAPVRLESHGVARHQTTTNAVGEFSFDDIPEETYHLSVDLPEGEIALFCVYREGRRMKAEG